MADTISEVTRRSIIEYLLTLGTGWAGRLPEHEFLARLYDLASLPSNDHRFSNAARDIQQHRVINPTDWEADWVFFDSRFNIMWNSDNDFLRFLCETLHPVVRPNVVETQEMATVFNAELMADGWQIVQSKMISGRPTYTPAKLDGRSEIFEEPTGWQKVDRQFQEVRLRLDTATSEEQFQAIGLLCREVLISVAQAGFNPQRHLISDGIEVSNTDAKRMLEAVFETELVGGGHEEARAHAKAALKLALALQHKRTADFQMAALCSEATASVVNLLAVLVGRRAAQIEAAAFRTGFDNTTRRLRSENP